MRATKTAIIDCQFEHKHVLTIVYVHSCMDKVSDSNLRDPSKKLTEEVSFRSVDMFLTHGMAERVCYWPCATLGKSINPSVPHFLRL